MRWVLLLRAVNVGTRNRLAMADLRDLLEQLGHTDVRTVLNSGNAVFTSNRGGDLAAEVEHGLRERLRIDVRACVLPDHEVRALVDAVPDLPGYVVCSVLFERPPAAALASFLASDVSPEVVAGNERAVFIGYVDAGRTKLTNARLESALGVSSTARTPATLRKLLAD